MEYTADDARKALEKDPEIGKDDKRLIVTFINERKIVKNLGPRRVLKLFYTMKAITKLKGRKPCHNKEQVHGVKQYPPATNRRRITGKSPC